MEYHVLEQKRRRVCLFFTCGIISNVHILSEKIKQGITIVLKKKKKEENVPACVCIGYLCKDIEEIDNTASEKTAG